LIDGPDGRAMVRPQGLLRCELPDARPILLSPLARMPTLAVRRDTSSVL
jgi:hypothetical protein